MLSAQLGLVAGTLSADLVASARVVRIALELDLFFHEWDEIFEPLRLFFAQILARNGQIVTFAIVHSLYAKKLG